MNPQPAQSFVPLTAAPVPPAAREFRVAVISGVGAGSAGTTAGAEKKNSFQSLELARPVPLHGMEKKPCEPRISVQRDGDRVTHLRIQCACGQIIDLACVYDPPAQGAT